MKKLLFSISVIFFLVLGFSCRNDTADKKNTIITERIQYPVFIKSPYPDDTDWWIENLEGAKREKFVNLLLDAAFEGRVNIYDYFENNLLTKTQVENIFSRTDTLRIQKTTPPFNEIDTVIVQKLDRMNIHRITFMEEWTFDEKNFQLEKKVVGIAPAVTVYTDSSQIKGYKPLFWIYLDKKYPLNQ